MAEHWADVFVKFLYLSGFVILLLASIFMAIDAYVTEKSGKSSSHFKTTAKLVFGLWFLNIIALSVFGILAEWFCLGKWEMWATYGVALLIGCFTWMISRREPSKKDRNLILFSLLALATLSISVLAFISLFIGRY